MMIRKASQNVPFEDTVKAYPVVQVFLIKWTSEWHANCFCEIKKAHMTHRTKCQTWAPL